MKNLKNFVVLFILIFAVQSYASVVPTLSTIEEANEVASLIKSVVGMSESTHGLMVVRLMKDGPYLSGVKNKFESYLNQDGTKTLLKAVSRGELNSLDIARFVIILYPSLEQIPSNVIMFLNNVLEKENLKGMLSDLLTLASKSLTNGTDLVNQWAEIVKNTEGNGALSSAIANVKTSIENNMLSQFNSISAKISNVESNIKDNIGDQLWDIKDGLTQTKNVIQNDIASTYGILKNGIDRLDSNITTTTGSLRNRLDEVNNSLSSKLSDQSATLSTIKSNTATILSKSDSLLNLTSNVSTSIADLGTTIGTPNQGTLVSLVSQINGRLKNIQTTDRTRDASALYNNQNESQVVVGAIKSVEVPSVISRLPQGVLVNEAEGKILIPENFVGDTISINIIPEGLETVGNWVAGVDALNTPLHVTTPRLDGASYKLDIPIPSARELKDSIDSNNLMILAGTQENGLSGIKYTPISSNSKPWTISINR